MADQFFFVGPGRAGLSLGYALKQADSLHSLTFCGRGLDPPPHPLFIQGTARYVFGLERPGPGTTAVILSVPDEALPEVSLMLAAQGDAPPGCVAFHMSGALGTDPLAPLVGRGYGVGTLHPLQALADPMLGAEQLFGVAFAVSGDPAAVSVARRLVNTLGGAILQIPLSKRPLYHAAAVFASNYLMVLLDAAGRLMAQAGVPPDEAVAAVLPLAKGSLENLSRLGPEHALTGPVARGDVETVRLHLKSLPPRERALYSVMGRELVELARLGGLDEDRAEELLTLMEAKP
jgi:predicted short-subunit dehydrogenase-like oxidoreductase (DUF2520 family)